MIGALKCSILLQALFARMSLAERRNADLMMAEEEEVPDAKHFNVKGLMSIEDKICGGPEIWYQVTKDQTPVGVQNINWKKIEAIAEEYIESQQMHIKIVEASLENLAADIERIRGKEHIKDAAEEQVRALVEAGAAPFGSVETARRTNCGSPAAKPRAPRGAYKTAKDGFAPEAEKVFQGSVKLGHAPMLKVCQEMLTCENGQATCYCETLCQSFRDIAQKVSDKNVGEHTGDADEVVRKHNALQEELVHRQMEVGDCYKAKDHLHEFGNQIELLKETAHERFQKLQDAEQALVEAQEELADMEDDLLAEQEEEAKAMAILQSANGKLEAAAAALKKLSADEEALTAQVKQCMADSDAAIKAMNEALGANKAMHDLRELVSVTIMKMEMFFDQAVQAPVRSLGITADRDLDTIFVGAPEEMSSAGAMREAVEAMSTFCSQDGKAAIEDMKGKVDLAPLCQFETAANIKKDINKAVADGLKIVKGRLAQVQGWLNPYRGQPNMNDTVAAALTVQGEPAGLRRIISTYGNSGFYMQYLKNWKVGGPFIALLRTMNSTVTSLQQSVDALEKSLADLKNQLATTTASREAAEKELEKATADQALAQEKQAELKSHVEALTAKGEKMKKNIEDFEAQVEEARKMYTEALQRISAAHKEGTSFLESWNQLQSEALDEVRVEAERARDSLLSARIEADKAEQRYSSAMARVSELEHFRSASSKQHAEVFAHHRLQ